MIKIKYLSVFAVIVILVVLQGCSDDGAGTSPTRSHKRKEIKLSYSHPANYLSEIHTAAWVFQKYIEDHSDTLVVKLYPANILGQERDIYEGIQLGGGGASCVISGTAILNNFNPKIGILDLPYLWEDYEHVHRVLDGEVGDILADGLGKRGFKVLAWMDSWGYRNIVTSKKEVKNADDLRGLKIRTIATSNYIEAINAMGSNATPMSFGEVYSALQTGVLDGFEHTVSVVDSNKYYEVADYIAITRHLFGPLVFVYSQAQWDELDQAEQGLVLAAAEFARDVQRGLAPVREKEAIEHLKQKKMTINEIDTTVFQRKAETIQDDFARANDVTELLKSIRALKTDSVVD